MSCEKKIQVSKTDSAIDEDFERIRNKFDNEMRRMEDEMSRFRGSLIDHNRDLDSRSMSPSSRRHETDTFVNSFESPLIRESSDGKMLKLRFDLTEYKPEEIVVKTIDNKLQVSAKHEERSDARSVFREYNREFLLPEGVDPDLIRSSLSTDGVLTVEAPLPRAEHKRVSIEKH